MVSPTMFSSASLGTSSNGNSPRSQYGLTTGSTSVSANFRTRCSSPSSASASWSVIGLTGEPDVLRQRGDCCRHGQALLFEPIHGNVTRPDRLVEVPGDNDRGQPESSRTFGRDGRVDNSAATTR